MPAILHQLSAERCGTALPDIWTMAPCRAGVTDIWTMEVHAASEAVELSLEQANVGGRRNSSQHRCWNGRGSCDHGVASRLSRSFSMDALPVGGNGQFRMRDGAPYRPAEPRCCVTIRLSRQRRSDLLYRNYRQGHCALRSKQVGPNSSSRSAPSSPTES